MVLNDGLFLKAALASAAAFSVGCPGAMPRPVGQMPRPRLWTRKTLWLPKRWVVLPPCGNGQAVIVAGVTLATTHRLLGRFLADPKQHVPLQDAVSCALSKLHCVDPNRPLAAQVQRAVAREVVALYQRCSGRAVSANTLRVVLSK